MNNTYENNPGVLHKVEKNKGNPCVRQSRLYREGCSGNVMKEILGQSQLKWDTTCTEGCFQGGHVYDHYTENNLAVQKKGKSSPKNFKDMVKCDEEEIEVVMVGNEAAWELVEKGPKPEAPARVSASTGKGFRPFSGKANYQTYNIFTGE